MTTHVVLFTRDLRVHDHPALDAAAGEAERVLPLFVLDEGILQSPYAAPNRLAFLHDSLVALRVALRAFGADLVVRRGHLTQVLADVLQGVGASVLHVTEDVSTYADHRSSRLERLAADLRVDLRMHPGHVLVSAGEVQPTGGDHFRIFTPYWRRWVDAPWRAPVAAPSALRLPDGVDPGVIPALRELVDEAPSPGLLPGGEPAGRTRLDTWLDSGIERYEETRDLLAEQGTSRLSADLHFGTVSVAEVVDRLDRRRSGHDAFLRQLCWREFNHQLLAANPTLTTADFRARRSPWRDDDEAFAAWADGRTGVPVVDAGMRELRHEGWMHNRARLLTASYLTKHLDIHWRRGAAHFARWLVDGDVANNWASWQWVAGTGTDPRRNRRFNIESQTRRYDPDGSYVRRWVPEALPVG